jgi:hypothetical protein
VGDELICLGVQLQEVDLLDSRVHPNGAVAHGRPEGLGGSPFSIWPALSRMVVRTSKGAPRMFIVGERHMTRRYDDGWRMVSRVTGR